MLHLPSSKRMKIFKKRQTKKLTESV